MNIYYYNGTLWKDVAVLDSSFCEETIDRFNRISLDFVLPSEERVPELCHVTWRGEEYTLYTAPKVVKVSTREYRYTLILEGRYKELERVLVKDKLGRTKFVFTGRADQYADLISGCIDGWSTGTCTTGDRSQVIAFSNNSLLDACRMVASKFETEVHLDGGRIAFGRVEKYKGDPLTLAYRQGLQKEITTEPDSKETAVGRVYVMGGNQNIDPGKYGSRTLHLPKGGSLSVEGHTFRVDAAGRYISLNGDTRLNTSERALDATTIYPKRVGTISKVEQKGDEWDVIDETNPVDYTQHRVGGDVMRLEFQSGRLAGRSFDLTTKDDKLTGYVHAEKRFSLVRREIDGVLMPEPGTFYPSVGDKYAIFGCSLPDEYVASAEAEMLSIGARYMAERLEARVQYRAELDGLWAKKNWGAVAHKLTIGTIARLEGTANEVRISSVRTALNSPYTPRITFSNAPYMVGSLTTQIATLESAEVRTREETRQVFLHLQARTYEDTKVVREMIERLSLEGFTQAIKPETLQSMYAVIGSPALQFDFVQAGGAVPFSWSEGKGGTITIPGQRIQRKASGTTLEPGDKTTVTDIPALTYTLKAEEQQAYVYIELSPAPHFVISTTPLAISTDRLLVGLLNGEEGKRAFTPLYGFTEITPGQLKTDLIRSQDGKSYWDLLSGKFATTGDLLIGDPKGDTCLAYIDGVLYVKGLMVNVGSSSTTIEDALIEQERKIENAKKVRQPIIKNGTWWVWDDTTNQLIDSGKPAQGESGHSLTSSLAFVEGEIRNGVVTKDPVVEYIVYYDGVALDDKLVYDTAGAYEQSFEDNRILIVGKNRFRLYFEDNYRSQPNGISQTYVITYKGLTTTATATLPNVRDGERGLQGLQGKDGRDGINGKDGTSSYTHIAYATDNKGGNFSQSPEGCDYIGMYVDSNPTDSTNPNDYRWTKFVGEDGRNGSDGTPGKPGKDGRTPYLHIAYANSSDGKQGFSVTESSGRGYIGQYTDYLQPDSSDPARYTWSRIKGEQGATGKDGAPGRDGHSFTATLRVEGEVVDGRLSIYHLRPSFFYDGREVTGEIDNNFLGRCNLNEAPNHLQWGDWEPYYNNGEYDLSDTYTGPGVSFEVKATYKGLTAVAAAFVPHVISPEKLKELEEARFLAEDAQAASRQMWEYVDGAFRDGVVNDAEAKAIKTYINEVDAQWQSALGAYEKVYTNSLLIGDAKTTLLDCKTTLAGKVSDLTSYITSAISDGKATTAEVDGVNSRYNAYKVALKDFQKALKEAEDFIRSKGAGGTFLGEAVDLGDGGYVKLYNRLHGQYAKAGDTVKMVTDGSYDDVTWKKGKIYILGLKYGKYGNELVWEQLTGKDGAPGRDGRDGRDGVDGKDGVGADYSKEVKELQDGLASANTAIDTLNNCRQMLKNKKITLDKLPDSLRWIYEAFANGKTEIKGGLILSKYIGLSNSSDKVTSYLSGQDGAGAHMLAAGVSGLGDTNAVSFINYDGTAKFGSIKINRDSIYIDADDSGSGVHQVVHDRLYITRSGIFAYLDRYISGGIGEGIFKANYEQGFHSKRVSIGDGGTSIIQAPRGNTMGLQIQGNLHVFGDKLEYNDQRILYENKPRTHYMTSDGGNVYLTKDDSLVLIGNEALSSAHCTITLPDASTVKVGWRCKVTTIGAVVKGSITVKTNYSSQKMFFGSDRQVSYTRDYTEKTNVLVIIRIPEQSTNNGKAYWFIKEIKAW